MPPLSRAVASRVCLALFACGAGLPAISIWLGVVAYISESRPRYQ
jgi:hypothetical protein